MTKPLSRSQGLCQLMQVLAGKLFAIFKDSFEKCIQIRDITNLNFSLIFLSGETPAFRNVKLTSINN